MSKTMKKGKMRDSMKEVADKETDKKVDKEIDKKTDKETEDDDDKMIQRLESQLEGLGLSEHSNALWSRLWQMKETCLRSHISPSNRALYLHSITGRFQF